MKIDWTPGSKGYGLPTGNNARHEKGLVEFEVVKMKRKYVTLMKKGWLIPEDYAPLTGMSVGGDWNAGYEFYSSPQGYADHLEINRKRMKIIGVLQRFELQDSQIEAMYNAIKWPEVS